MRGYKLNTLLIVAVLASGVAALLPLALTGAEALQASYRENAQRDVLANVSLLKIALPTHEDDLAQFIGTAQKASDTRFTIIDQNGTVIADSNEEADRMENHANRPEIQAALAGRTETEIRKSPTLGTDWIYVAVPLENGMVARGAASLDDLNKRLSQWWQKTLLGFGLSLLVLVCLALLVARKISRPLEAAVIGANKYAAGDFSYRIPQSGSTETRILASSLDTMASELDARFTQITRQKEEMNAVFANMSEGILAVDPLGRILLINRTAEELLLVGSDTMGLVLEEAIRTPELLDCIVEARAASGVLEREIRITNKADKELLLHVNAIAMRQDGEEIGVLAVFRDITRIKQFEIMSRDFFHNVTHELRTPVTAIQSSLETLAESALENKEEARDFIEMALKHTRRMGRIIGNLLLLAGMESGDNNRQSVSRCNVKGLLEEAVALCLDDATNKSVRFNLSCDDTLTALTNPQLLVHALVNLIDNAIKYGPENGTITIAAREENGEVEIIVSDEGPGIAPRYQSRVFERFYRINDASRTQKGSGLGLSLVKHIAMAQGGNIVLKSELGSGSTFTLVLPK